MTPGGSDIPGVRPYLLQCDTPGHHCRARSFGDRDAAWAASLRMENAGEGCKPLLLERRGPGLHADIVYDHATA